MGFELIGSIVDREGSAAGVGVRIRERLRKAYGGPHWRKMKGVATIRLPKGAIRTVEFMFVDFRWRSGRSFWRYRERHDLRQSPAEHARRLCRILI
jgi:hypothetical protein